LDRRWQKVIGYFVVLNGVWIGFYNGSDWALWIIAMLVLAPILLIFVLERMQVRPVLMLLLGLAVLLLCTAAFGADSAMYPVVGLFAALAYNAAGYMLAKRKLAAGPDFSSSTFQKKTTTVVYSLTVLGTLIVLNLISHHFHYEWDVTQNKLNSLSEQSVKMIDALEGPLVIRAFFDEQNEQRLAAKLLLERFDKASGQVETILVDPDKENLQAEKYNAQDGMMIVQYQNKQHITPTLSEEGIAQAIAKVTKVKETQLCFVQGHGELQFDNTQEPHRSLSAIEKGMENEGYPLREVRLNTDSALENCGVVIVASPQQAWTEGESQILDQYLAEGGSALLMLDPVISTNDPSNPRIQPTGLRKLLFNWGIEMDSNMLLEKQIALYQGEQIVNTIRSGEYGNHPIVDALKSRQTVFHGVRSVHQRPDYLGTLYPLIYTLGPDLAWSKSNMQALMVEQIGEPDANDMRGPVPFAIASEKENSDSTTKLVVIGDSDFASDSLVLSQEFNYDLFLNTINWLSGDETQISIRPKLFKASAIELTPTQIKNIFYIAIVLIPMLVLIFGLNLWWIRKKRG
jgi:ABC-type uncharacterized transport system involved in gliding motility auxiliary subunit